MLLAYTIKYFNRRYLRFVWIFFVLISFNSCAQNNSVKRYSHELKTLADYNSLKGVPLNQAYSNVSSVKLAFDKNTKKLYFINSTKFIYHIDFCVDEFGVDDNIATFNNEQYGQHPNRRFYLGSLSYFSDQKEYVLEFVSEDELTSSQVKEVWLALNNGMKNIGTPKVLINNLFLQRIHENLKDIPTITPEVLYGAQKQSSLVIGNAYGYARKINLKDGFNNIKPTDIIFFDGTPLQLPICAGVITSTIQTPLSHINVLCHNRKTPAAVLIQYDSIIDALKAWDQPIHVKIERDNIQIKLSDADAVEAFHKRKPKPALVNLRYNKTALPILVFKKNSAFNKLTIGSKAFGVGQLYKIQNNNKSIFKVPNHAFAIPFYFYDNHLQSCKIDSLIKMLDNQAIDKPAILKLIRKKITTTPVAPSLIRAVTKQIKLTNPKANFRFRSSSNAEDLANFNGAGLYESVTGNLIDSNKNIERAIRKVWASIWSEAAYNERQLFNINQATVSMSILVHQAFGDEDINGVAITKNLFREGFTGFTINVQKGEVSVVEPDSNVQCDQLLILPSESFTGNPGDFYTQYINVGNLNKGQPVLSKEQCVQLYKALDAVKQHYFSNHLSNQFTEYDRFGLDVEFKFIGKDLYLKQVRPYR